jgi:hypothetical protein
MTREEYRALIDECRDILVEASFASSWATIEGNHQLGKRILADYYDAYVLSPELITAVAIGTARKVQTIEDCIKFARLFPDLNKLPEGKNINWHQIRNKYLKEG